MKLSLKKQTRLIIYIPIILSLIMVVGGILGISVEDSQVNIDTFTLICSVVSFVLIFSFTLIADIKRGDTQWNPKILYIEQIGGLILFLLALALLNIDLLYTLLILFGFIYLFTLFLFIFFKNKLIISEKQRINNKMIKNELPYEFTSKKIYLFSKYSGYLIIGTAILGIIFMYSNGSSIYEVFPFSIVCVIAYLLSKMFILHYEKQVEKKISDSFYQKLDASESISMIDKLLKENLNKEKDYELRLKKIEILEYIGEHELAYKMYKKLGNPSQKNEFTYEFLGLEFIEKSDSESYFKALKRIEKKIEHIKKEKDRVRISRLLDLNKTEISIRFNKKIDEEKLSYFEGGYYLLTKIYNNYILGRYYFNIKDYKASKEKLEYVITNGSVLKKYIHRSLKILDKINEKTSKI